MDHLIICRKWNCPTITIRMDHEGLEVAMSVTDFVTALADESAELLAAQIAGSAGNPLMLLTNAQLVARIVAAVEGEAARKIFTDAADRVFAGMKAETAKVV